jgi:hypothetical protein
MAKSRSVSLLLVFSCLAVLSAASCVSTEPPPGTAFVQDAPPAMQVETYGVAPDADSVWVGGYWNWTAPNYVWVPGTWQHRPRPNAVWVAPEWRHHRNGWWRVDGHWR